MADPPTPPPSDAAAQARISAYWDRHAGSYNAYQTSLARSAPARQAWRKVWATALPTPPAQVLDVGTGTGYVAQLLAEMGYRVTGIDLAEGMLERARRNVEGMANRPALMIGDAVDPDFPHRSFDAITCRYLLWTLRRPGEALKSWLRLLRPGGMLAVADSTWFPEGIHSADAPPPGSKQEDFRVLYDGNVVESLPLAEAETIEPTVAAIRDAGFCGVQVVPLEEILEIDRRYGVAEGHRAQMQYLITGTAP